MLKSAILLVTLFAGASVTFAQMTVQQAEAKLAAKQAREAAAATQPSGLTNGEVSLLRAQIELLTAENAKLSATIATLQQVQAMQGGPAANGATSFWGATEARVGMTLDDLKRLPNACLELIREDSSGALYKVSTGKVDEYGQETVADLPSTALGSISHTKQVVIGSHPAEIQRVLVDSASGKVIKVELDGEGDGGDH